MSFVDDYMNEEMGRRMNPVTRDTGALAPPGEIAAQNDAKLPGDPTWTWGGTIAAAFRQNNLAMSSLAYMPDEQWDPNYKPDLSKLPDHYLPYTGWIGNARSQAEYDSMLRSIDKQEQDKRDLANAPWALSMGASMAAGLTDPTVLVPGAGLVRRVEGGYSVLKSAAVAAGAVGSAVALQESGLHATQVTRTGSESAWNIGFSMVFGGLLGAAGAKIMSRMAPEELAMAERGYNGILENVNDEVPASKVLEGVATPPEYRKLPEYDWAKSDVDFESAKLDLETLRKQVEEYDTAVTRMSNGEDVTPGEVPQRPNVERIAELESRVAELDRERAARTQAEATTDIPPDARSLAELATGNSSEVGAAVAKNELDMAKLSVAGRLANLVGDMTKFMNPAMRGLYRQDPLARKIMLDLQGGTVYTNANFDGLAVTPGGAAKDIARYKIQSRLRGSQEKVDQVYSEATRNGTKMRREDFNRAVGLAMTREDKDPNPYVQKAAETWRQGLFDPFKNEGIEVGLLPHDVTPAGALSYFSRVHDVKMINAHQEEFYNRLMPVVEKTLSNAYAEQQSKLAAKTGVIDYEMELLKASPEQRAQMLGEIDNALESLELRGSAVKQKDILEKQAAARELEKAGDIAGAEALRAEVKMDKELGGRDLYNYKQARRQLASMKRLLGQSVPGQQAEVEKALDTLVAIEDKQRASLEHLVERGIVAKRKLDKVSDDKLEEFYQQHEEMFKTATGQAWDNLLKLKGERDRVTERINQANEVLAKKVEAAKAGPEGSNFEALRVQQEEARKLVEKLSPARDRIDRMALKQQAIAERLAQLDERMNSAADDFDEMRTAITESFDRVIDMYADKTLRQGERVQRIRDKMANMGEEVTKRELERRQAAKTALIERFENKWMPNREKEPNFSGLAKEIVDEYFRKVTNRNYGAGRSELADFATPITKGPLRGRTAFFSDELLNRPVAGQDKGFLDNDATRIAHRYARIMAGEIELTKQFGFADMRDQIEVEIPKSYAQQRERVIAAPDAKAAWAAIGETGKAPKTKEQILLQLAEDEHGAIEDIKAVRDLIRGNYKVAENNGNFASFTRMATAFNYIRSMGGVVISNLTELYRPAMVHGLGPYMSIAAKAVTGQLDGIKLSTREAKLAGLVAERVLHTRVATQWGEIADPLAHGTAGERLMEKAAFLANKWSGLGLFTDFEESFASVLTQDRMLNALVKGAPKEKDKRWLAFLNLGEGDQRAIAEQFNKYGSTVDGVRVANTEKWDNPLAVEAYRQAVMRDVNSVIVQRTPGDAPLLMSRPIGRLLFQFKAYNMAAHQKVMLRGMQEGPGNMVSGLIGMTTLGGLVAYLQAWRGGEERVKKWLKSAENPGFVIGEGLDRSGLFPMLFDVANTADSAGRAMGINFNPLKTPLIKGASALAGKPLTEAGDSTRWSANNTLANNVLGPSFSLMFDDLPQAGLWANKKLHGKQPSASDTKAAMRVLPYGSYLGMREMLQVLNGDSPWIGR